MLGVPPAQGRGDAKPSHPQAIELTTAFSLKSRTSPGPQPLPLCRQTPGREGAASLRAALFFQTLYKSGLIHCHADVLLLVQTRTEPQGSGGGKRSLGPRGWKTVLKVSLDS